MDPGRAWRAGIDAVGLLQTTLSVTFSSPMDIPYVCILMAPPGIVITLSSINKTASGFSVDITVNVAGNVRWVCIPFN